MISPFSFFQHTFYAVLSSSSAIIHKKRKYPVAVLGARTQATPTRASGKILVKDTSTSSRVLTIVLLGGGSIFLALCGILIYRERRNTNQ